ncbi:hypothetical protein EaACW_1998 [Erwinia amylovora ACW56400]|nr:hypothetical protein EaACW_1998 [Erwinia amylovora ACW56400]CCO78845.1 hypothetical protein BN432_2048 [Erwinia amylovora Ea356]CCO86424.1 hypothetical protein BN434_2037 [Erwinia amylovora CFBP 2585]CCO90210.1 hypothetical protein BN435_2040 [Erwinia amylovora 01SFR-BO]CCO99322.1 hypothetical protein BN438_2041 [Erwinia amylovora UPN527]
MSVQRAISPIRKPPLFNTGGFFIIFWLILLSNKLYFAAITLSLTLFFLMRFF